MRIADLSPRLRGHTIALLFFGAIAFYCVTAPMAPALFRHTCDGGTLAFLNQVPGAVEGLLYYPKPIAGIAFRWGPSRVIFESLVEMWWSLLDPPDTTC